MKPYKGRLKDWFFFPCEGYGLGFVVRGTSVDHPEFAGEVMRTSYVVAYNKETGEIETRNSRYTLVGHGYTGFMWRD